MQVRMMGSTATSDNGLTFSLNAAIITGLMLIYGALAIAQWRRVEA
jgi:hypothetical protein